MALQLPQFAMMYGTMIAVFCALHYFVALAGGLQFNTTDKLETVLAALHYTVTHATFGTPHTEPQDTLARMVTTVQRVCSIVLLVLAIRSTDKPTSTPQTTGSLS